MSASYVALLEREGGAWKIIVDRESGTSRLTSRKSLGPPLRGDDAAFDAIQGDGVDIYQNPEGAGWLQLNVGGFLQAVDGDFLRGIR